MSRQLTAIGKVRGSIAAGLLGSDVRTSRDSAVSETDVDLPAAAAA